MGFLIAIILIASVYLFANLTSHKCKTAMIIIDGENVTLTCVKCGKSYTLPQKVFEERFGKCPKEYVEAHGHYISF